VQHFISTGIIKSNFGLVNFHKPSMNGGTLEITVLW